MRAIHEFRVPADHPALPGHFPGRPVVPGVVLLDLALAAIAAEARLHEPLQLLRVKFLALVRPEEPVSVHVGEPGRNTLAFACNVGERRVLAAVVRLAETPQPCPA